MTCLRWPSTWLATSQRCRRRQTRWQRTLQHARFVCVCGGGGGWCFVGPQPGTRVVFGVEGVPPVLCHGLGDFCVAGGLCLGVRVVPSALCQGFGCSGWSCSQQCSLSTPQGIPRRSRPALSSNHSFGHSPASCWLSSGHTALTPLPLLRVSVVAVCHLPPPLHTLVCRLVTTRALLRPSRRS